MEQQEREDSPIPSSGGIPAFANTALFLVGPHIPTSLFGIILSSIPALKEWRMGTFLIGRGAILLNVLVATSLIIQFLNHRLLSDLGFSLEGRGKDILYGFLMAILIYVIGFAVCLLTGQIEAVGVHFHWNDLFLNGLLFVTTVIVEETVMRGHTLGRSLRT